MRAMEIDFRYLSEETDRYGNLRLYARRYGRRVRIREKKGTAAFATAYAAALVALDAMSGRRPPNTPLELKPAARGTLAWLGAQYFASEEFKGLDVKSQANRRQVLEECFREPHKDDDPDPMGNCPLPHFSSQKVKRLRDLKAGKPGAANNRRKYLSAMFGWAIEQTPPLAKVNPVRDVRRVKYATEGFHTWTPDEVRQFEARHAVGTKARLALALLLFTGTRRSDMVTLGRQHVRGGWLRFVPRKTRHQRAQLSEKPLLPQLQSVIDASPCGDLNFLITSYGKPFTANGFGGWFRDRCNEAGLPHCSAHGLRKAGAALAAENGATVNQLMAIFDWVTPNQARVYTQAADRKRMAGDAMKLLARGSE